MLKNTKQSLEQINEISRQILSRILEIQVNLKTVNLAKDDDTSEEQSDINKLMENRQELISCFFEQHSAEDISAEKLLINKLYQLDQELASASNSCKQSIMEQVIKLKKSNKVTKSYQKY